MPTLLEEIIEARAFAEAKARWDQVKTGKEATRLLQSSPLIQKVSEIEMEVVAEELRARTDGEQTG